MIQAAQVALGVYGFLLIVGGLIGMIRSGSTISMVAGGAAGVVALIGLWLSLSDPAVGLLLGALLALLLTGMFINRFVATKKMMPAGVILVLSLAVAILLLLARQAAVDTGKVEATAMDWTEAAGLS